MLWLALHFPRLPLEVFAEPDEGQVTVLLEDNRVLKRNAAAHALGIELGTTLATAHSICPGLVHRQRDERLEAERLRHLAEQLYRFSAHVSLQAPDCIVLEIGASLKLFGDHSALAMEAVALCESAGHIARARVASTPWASIALARAGAERIGDVPLAEAGLELAGVTPNTIERFANMGIYTLGPVLDLPAKALGKRFGTPLLTYLKKLSGEIADPREPISPRHEFDEQYHLLRPISDKNTLLEAPQSPMRRLAQDLKHWLIAHQLGCGQLEWHFVSHNRSEAVMPVRFAHPKQALRDFVRVSQLALEQCELPEEVLTVRLEAKRLRPWQDHSQNLFALAHAGESPDDKDGDITEIVDEIRARLGDSACYGVDSVEQHAPENAWQLTHLPRPAANDETPPTGERPLWLFDPPRPVARTELSLLKGPERIQTRWWQGAVGGGGNQGANKESANKESANKESGAACRDYYVAQHAQGPECWAFVDEADHWYLHGYFG